MAGAIVGASSVSLVASDTIGMKLIVSGQQTVDTSCAGNWAALLLSVEMCVCEASKPEKLLFQLDSISFPAILWFSSPLLWWNVFPGDKAHHEARIKGQTRDQRKAMNGAVPLRNTKLGSFVNLFMQAPGAAQRRC
jgi:hypothetical protein